MLCPRTSQKRILLIECMTMTHTKRPFEKSKHKRKDSYSCLDLEQTLTHWKSTKMNFQKNQRTFAISGHSFVDPVHTVVSPCESKMFQEKSGSLLIEILPMENFLIDLSITNQIFPVFIFARWILDEHTMIQKKVEFMKKQIILLALCSSSFFRNKNRIQTKTKSKEF